jgi:hypothetical protein
MLKVKKAGSPEDFWQEYEEKIGEKVLARGLGRYISGWEEFDSQGWNSLWGLIIASSGGFRFHHFPQKNWIESLSLFGNSREQKEKTIFIPKEKIISVNLIKESKWWKKIIASPPPMLTINYRDETETERQVLLEVDMNSNDLSEKLSGLKTAVYLKPDESAATAAP